MTVILCLEEKTFTNSRQGDNKILTPIFIGEYMRLSTGYLITDYIYLKH